MPIPTSETDVEHSYTFDPTILLSGGKPFMMYSVGFHMHRLGTRGLAKIQRQDGKEECLLKIDNWDFNWQGPYYLKAPVQFNPGDKL